MTMTDAWAKLTRSRLLMSELSRTVQEFRDNDPYEFLQYDNSGDESDPLIRMQWRLRVKQTYPMSAAWIVGDCIQNMRSALDTALAAVVVREAETQPTPSQWRRIQYPITDTPAQFEQPEKNLKQWISPSRVEAMGKNQPWQSAGDDTPYLAMLRDLSNTDKHQQLLVADQAVVSAEFDATGIDNRKLEIKPRPALMKDGETVLTVKFKRPVGSGVIEIRPRFEQIEIIHHAKYGYMPLAISLERMHEAAFFAVMDLTFDFMTDGDKYMAKAYIENREKRETELRRTVTADDRL